MRADELEIKNLSVVLAYFSLFSGLDINSNKSFVSYIGRNNVVNERFEASFGCKAEKLPIIYLEYQLGSKSLAEVTDKVLFRMQLHICTLGRKKVLSNSATVICSDV